jgi:hypothetical protein
MTTQLLNAMDLTKGTVKSEARDKASSIFTIDALGPGHPLTLLGASIITRAYCVL